MGVAKINKRSVGKEQEKLAQEYLVNQGYQIVACNFSCRTGEIDIIAYDKEYLVFIEVKYRASIKNGYPGEALTLSKRKKIANTAAYYMMKNKIYQDTPCRFDVVCILNREIQLIKDAFDVC